MRVLLICTNGNINIEWFQTSAMFHRYRSSTIGIDFQSKSLFLTTRTTTRKLEVRSPLLTGKKREVYQIA